MAGRILRAFHPGRLSQAVLLAIAFLTVWPAPSSANSAVRKISDSMTDGQPLAQSVRRRGDCAILMVFDDTGLAIAPVMRSDGAKDPLLPKPELKVDTCKPWILEEQAGADRTRIEYRYGDPAVLAKTRNQSAVITLAAAGASGVSASGGSESTGRQAAASRKMRPKYILYAFMAKANERVRLSKFKPDDVNIHFGMLSGNAESEIFHGMLLQNNDFLQKRFIGPGTLHKFGSRGRMRNAMLDTYDPDDPYKPMRFTPVGHEIMDALAAHMKLDILVEAVASHAGKRRSSR